MQNDKEKFKKDFIKRLISFSVEIFEFCNCQKYNKLLASIFDQLVRSATSIGANVIEAKASSSRRDYIKFFEIALKSANETKYWLFVIKEIKPDSKLDFLLDEVCQIANVIGSSILTLKGKK